MGGCGGRGRRLRPETSQSGAGLGRLLARGGAWPSGKAVAELCVALCQRQQLAQSVTERARRRARPMRMCKHSRIPKKHSRQSIARGDEIDFARYYSTIVLP